MDRLPGGLEKIIIGYLGQTYAVGIQLDEQDPIAAYETIFVELGYEPPARYRTSHISQVLNFVAENGWAILLKEIIGILRSWGHYFCDYTESALRSGSIETVHVMLDSVRTTEAMLEAVRMDSIDMLRVIHSWAENSDRPGRRSRRWRQHGINYQVLFCEALKQCNAQMYRVLRTMFQRVPKKGCGTLIYLAARSRSRELLQMCLLHTRMAGNPQALGFIARGAYADSNMDLFREAISKGPIDCSAAWNIFESAIKAGDLYGLKLILPSLSTAQFERRISRKPAWCTYILMLASKNMRMLNCVYECGIPTQCSHNNYRWGYRGNLKKYQEWRKTHS